MADALATKSKRGSGHKGAVGKLFVLELSGGSIHSMSPDGSDRKVIVTDCRLPDGIAVDVAAGHIYWTNMGVPNRDDGSIERADLDGGIARSSFRQGGTFTPKQLQLDTKSGKLYWCDREGMRVMRANLDGSHVETLVETGQGDRDRGRTQRDGASALPSTPKRGADLLDAKRSDNARTRPHLPRGNRNPAG